MAMSMYAQLPVSAFELELSTGFTTPLKGYRGGESRTGMSYAAEIRYNFPRSAWDMGILVDLTNARLNFHNVVVDGYYNPEKVYRQTNRTLSIAVTTDYNFNRGNMVSSFVGLGLGIGRNKTHGSVAYPTDDTSVTVIPRFGLEFFNAIRLSCQGHISRKGYNVISLNIGYTIGGRRR